MTHASMKALCASGKSPIPAESMSNKQCLKSIHLLHKWLMVSSQSCTCLGVRTCLPGLHQSFVSSNWSDVQGVHKVGLFKCLCTWPNVITSLLAFIAENLVLGRLFCA